MVLYLNFGVGFITSDLVEVSLVGVAAVVSLALQARARDV